MKISPLDIAQKRFPKKFRGLEEEEVYAFLALVSESMEELLREMEELVRENARMKEIIAMHESCMKEYRELSVAAWSSAERCMRCKTKGNNPAEIRC